MGNILQISNQVTLGMSEHVIIDNLNRLVVQVSQREDRVRKKLLEKNGDTLKDTIMRSLGLLLNAYKISFEEAIDLISNVSFGVYCGMVGIDINSLNDLIVKIQPAHIQKIGNRTMESTERDIIRAKMIKDTLQIRKLGL
jgi:protein arginine kinase